MLKNAGKAGASLAALGALALGGSAIASAASSSSSTTQSASQGQPRGPHVGANGKTEAPLTGDVAASVKKAALAKIPGGTIERVETDVDHGSPYEAHVRKADGTSYEVLVNKDF